MNSGIKSVSYYIASPVECCDRCSAGIKHVFAVSYKDGQTQKYGSECINKILANAPNLKTLFAKNSKLLIKYRGWLSILTGPVENMPRGSEYFDSGLFFIGDSEGRDIFVDRHWFFHPLPDFEKNAGGGRYVADPNTYAEKCMAEINGKRGVSWLQAEVSRLELFLGRVLAKAQMQVAA